MKDKDDWFKLETEEQSNFYRVEKGCELHYIKCPAGSLVLWDSRTIHCGKEPDSNRTKSNYRCCVYLCYTPRSMATPTILNKKIETDLFNYKNPKIIEKSEPFV